MTNSKDASRKAFPHDCYEQSFSVSYDFPVHFTRDLFHPENDILASVFDRRGEGRRHRVKVFVDDGVAKAIPGFVERVKTYISSRSSLLKREGEIEIVPGGEREKRGWDLAGRIMSNIAEGRLCRQSFVLAIGGGSVLDIVGLAGALVHRGLRLIRVPSTVLAQDDAGVGVKNGIDDRNMKNFAGTFSPPFAVLIDYDLLHTLEPKYYIGGISEAFKVSIIKDLSFFDFLCLHADKLRERDEAAIEETVKRCAILHLEHIRTSGDPFEFGAARPLDFGHWSAHKLELLSDYDLGHGQAVSIGIALDTFYAFRVGLITIQERDRIFDALERTDLPIWSPLLELKTSAGKLEILKGLEEFQEHLGGRLNVTLPDGIGRKIEIHDMDPSIIEEAILYLKQRSYRVSKIRACG